MARRFTGSRPRLKKSWTSSQIISSAPVIISGTQIEVCSVILGEGILGEPTLLRTRGEFLITGTPNAASDSDVFALGLTLVPETTRAVGGASLPGPIVDASADFWIWHNYVPVDALTLTAGDPQSITTNARITLDAKAMRRWPSDSSLVLIAEADAGSFSTVAITGAFRALTGI